ncbi:MAG: translation initiation factor IF-5A [Candidatus Aenigmarchaeota archaeon]|nr:translation initiation factor IF-5A [Candidatus Aenigmarchaeota archaeon]
MEETKTTEIKKCKPGSFIIIDDAPSKVADLKISKPGKHGDAKARLEAIGIFDKQKRVIVKPASAKVRVPVIEKRTVQVLTITGEHAQVMDMEDYSTYEAIIPEEIKDNVTEGREVVVWRFGKNVMIKELR